MAFQAVPDTAEVLTIFIANSISVQMTFYAEFPGGYSLADLTALANAADFSVGADFLPIMTQDILYDRTHVRGLSSIDDFEVSDQTFAGPGQVASGGMPNSVTIAIQRNSGLTGRSSRGRVYWVGLASSQLTADENFVATASVTAIVSAIFNMRTQLDGSGWDPVIVSRFTGGAKRAVGVTFPWINTLAINARVDSRRDRMPEV